MGDCISAWILARLRRVLDFSKNGPDSLRRE